MQDKPTLEQVEQLIAKLKLQEQIRIIASITERLGKVKLEGAEEENRIANYGAEVEAFLKMSDERAATASEEVDSADDIRKIREERTSPL